MSAILISFPSHGKDEPTSWTSIHVPLVPYPKALSMVWKSKGWLYWYCNDDNTYVITLMRSDLLRFECWNIDTLGPWKEVWAIMAVGLWSMLSTADVVNMCFLVTPPFNNIPSYNSFPRLCHMLCRVHSHGECQWAVNSLFWQTQQCQLTQKLFFFWSLKCLRNFYPPLYLAQQL